MTKIFEKIIKFGLYFLVFLVPLFWLPFSFEVYEFNKQYLLFFLVSIAFLAWLAKMILVDKEIRLKRTPFDIPILLFLLVAILSVIFSVDKNSSLFGFYGRFSNGLLGLLSLGIFYFLITNNVGSKPDVKSSTSGFVVSVNGLLKVFLLSVFFVILTSYFSIFGIWQKIGQIGLLGQIGRAFNPVSGSLEGLAIFLSVVIVLLVGQLLIGDEKNSKLGLAIRYLSLLGALGLLVIIDFSSAWIILVSSLGIFLIFALAKRIFRENVNRLLLPIFLIILAIFFLSFDISKFGNFNTLKLPREQVLDQATSWRAAFGAATENIKSGFLGSGIGTYHYDFAKFKPIEFNKTPLWAIRFDRAGGHISEILGTLGFLGLLSFLLLIVIFLALLSPLSKKLENFPLAMTFLALFIGQLIYYQNTVLAFSFWFVLGLIAVGWQSLTKELCWTVSFKNFPELNLVFSTILVFFFFVIFIGHYFGLTFYLADNNFLKSQLTPFGEERIKILEKATGLNPNFPTYRLFLARTLFSQISEETGKPADEQDVRKITDLVAKAIEQTKRATELSPNNVAAWETLGMIYRDIQPAAGSNEWAVKAFQKAVELEPANPVFYTELGKLYLISDIGKARESFAKAKKIKPDYIDALIQEALSYEREQNFDEILKRLEELVSSYPFNTEVRFQLGRVYYNKNKLDDAIYQFEQVVSLLPNHSNSLYSLGLAYSRKGDKEKAIFYFEKVLELNPGNKDVITILKELKK